MAKAPTNGDTATATAQKPKRVVNSDLVLYLIGPADAVNAVQAVEKDAKKVLDAQNAATERGEAVISRRFVIKRATRETTKSAA